MNKKGFTLLELLVVVLIIGILASIALPQYQMAVTKAKVASILPLMRRFKDALAEYKLQHGSYLTEDGDNPDADTLGVNWPTDWECEDDLKVHCYNDYWECIANGLMANGIVTCGTHDFSIYMYPSALIGFHAFSAGMYSIKHLPRSTLFRNTSPSSNRSASHAFLDET